ncbi:MAG TPA: hypothetical protein VGM88_09865 [Kofleriaceae bacterium]|jgi:anti-sigma factor RsiW
MTCESISPALVAFHFGEADDRAAVEAHLLACPTCLRELFDLKRAIEAGGDEAPSDASRVKLRAAVAALVAPPPRRRWHRPVALAFALSALLASAAATHVLTKEPISQK